MVEQKDACRKLPDAVENLTGSRLNLKNQNHNHGLTDSILDRISSDAARTLGARTTRLEGSSHT